MKLNGIDFTNQTVILDSNMFMTDYMRDYIKNDLIYAINECRKKGNEKFILNIPRTVLEELENLKEKAGSENIGVRTDALRGLNAAEALIKKGYARPIKSDYTNAANGFNDVAILTMLMELRRHLNIAVLSNDRNFARDMMILNNLHSVKSKNKISVYYISKKEKKVKKWLYDSKLDTAVRYANEIKRNTKHTK